MDRTIDYSALEKYSATFSERVLDKAYAHQHKISGQSILSISPVKQVNFFIIKALFDQWQREMDNLKSPYFDYNNEEVQIALEEFMNALSQHISVAESELKPLTEAAVQDALLLLLSPPTYYRRVSGRMSLGQWYVEDVKGWVKYVKIHRAPLEDLADRIATTGSPGVSADDATRFLQEVASRLTTDDLPSHLSAFSQVVPLSETDLLETSYDQPTAPPAEATDSLPSTPENDVPVSRTLNDELSPSQKATLADLHRQQKIANIKSYIGVNQRFMFIRELFDNDAEKYNNALDELEQQNTYIEAFNHLRNQYAQPYHWKMDSEEVVEFLEIVAKRF